MKGVRLAAHPISLYVRLELMLGCPSYASCVVSMSAGQAGRRADGARPQAADFWPCNTIIIFISPSGHLYCRKGMKVFRLAGTSHIIGYALGLGSRVYVLMHSE